MTARPMKPSVGPMPQRSILELGKSEESFAALVLEASNILKIRLDEVPLFAVDEEGKQQAQASNGPREEWTLNWLLKNMQLVEGYPGRTSPCLEPRVWLLLQEVILRIPSSTTARILKAHKFMSVVLKTLQWLQHNLASGFIRTSQTPVVDCSSHSSEDSSNAENSSGTIGATPLEAIKNPKKRKRDPVKLVTSDVTDASKLDVEKLYFCILSAVTQVQALTRDSPIESQGFAVEYMKAVLRSSPEQAAMILGSSMSVTSQILQRSYAMSSERDNHIYNACIPSILKIWDLRSVTADDSTGQSSSHAFSAECLLQTLDLLITCKNMASRGSNITGNVNSLENLLAKHVLLPIRAAFLDVKRADYHPKDDPESLSEALLRPLERGFSDVSTTTISTTFMSHDSVIPLLFDIAIKCVPRGTSKQRLAENPWLQELFSRLAQCASIFLNSSSVINLSRISANVLKQMLEVCSAGMVQIESSILETILTRFSGLTDIGFERPVDWALVSFCLQVDSDIFMTSSLSSGESTPNHFLEALLTKVTGLESYVPQAAEKVPYEKILNVEEQKNKAMNSDDCGGHFKYEDEQNREPFAIQTSVDDRRYQQSKGKSATNLSSKIRAEQERHASEIMAVRTSAELRLSNNEFSEYGFTLSNIILPLVDAFANARNLLGFFSYWQEQLNRILRARDSRHDATYSSTCSRSIWEDEELLNTAGHFVESSLTVGQIDNLLQSAFGNLAHLTAEEDAYFTSWAYFIIGDCLVHAYTSEATLTRLTETIKSIYPSLLRAVSKGSASRHKHGWRMWRALATIKRHWPGLRRIADFIDEEDAATRRAQELLGQAMSTEPPNNPHASNYTEELHAFNFILSSAHMENIVNEMSHVASGQAMTLAVTTILDYNESICNGARVGEGDGNLLTGQEWGETNESVESVDLLVLGCFAQIVISPKVLCYLDMPFQRRLLEQFYRCGLSQAERPELHRPTSIGYHSLWKRLLHSESMREDVSLASCVQDIQSISFLDRYNYDMHYEFNGKNHLGYTFAFEGLLSVPLQAYKSDQRSELCSRVLAMLRFSNYPFKSEDIVKHLNFLIGMVQHSGKSADFAAYGDTLWELVEVLSKLQETQGILNYLVLPPLRRYAQITLGYLFSTITHEQSSQCLKKLLEQLFSQIANFPSLDSPSGPPASIMILIEESLAFYWRQRTEFPESLSSELGKLPTLRKQYLGHVCSHLRKLREEVASTLLDSSRPDWTFRLRIILEGLMEFSDLLEVLPELGEVRSYLSWVSQSIPYLTESEDSEILKQVHLTIRNADHLREQLARLALLLGDPGCNTPEQILQATTVLRDMKSSREKKRLRRHLRSHILAIEPQEQMGLLIVLVAHDQLKDPDEERLLLLQVLINSQGDEIEDNDNFGPTLSNAFATLCKDCSETKDLRISILSMQCIDLLLRKKARAISQWHIESTLSAITVISSRLGTRFGRENSHEVYISLCRLFSTMLGVHRMKLGNRYHLMIYPLKCLLQCLFMPYSKNMTVTSGSPGEKSFQDGKDQATAYARLLSALCDPTVSAVSRSKDRSRQALSDKTKEARSTAGQHLPYLVMEYCHCQLKGRLAPGVKAALMPGLYTIFDVMSQDVMRTLNSAVDSSDRSIFKGLYDDYRRFGRWEGA